MWTDSCSVHLTLTEATMKTDQQRIFSLIVVAIVSLLAAAITVGSGAFLPIFSVTVLLALGAFAINWMKSRRNS